MRSKPLIASSIFILFVLLNSQCTGYQNIQTPDVVLSSTFIPETATSTVLPPTSMISIPTNDSKSFNLPDFHDLNPGQYILFKAYDKNVDNLFLLSTDKTIAKKFILDTEVGVSNDGKQFMIIQSGTEPAYILDVTTGKWTEISLGRTCLNPSWSPDKQRIAISCFINNISLEIFMLDTTSQSLVQITNCAEKGNSCIYPAWSFDGQNLAYYRYDERSGEHPRGICVLDQAHIESDTCMNEEVGPMSSDTNPVWSLDGNLIFSFDGKIKFYESGETEFLEIKSLDSGMDYLNYLEYSPDGNYLIFTSHDILYLYSFSTSVSEEIFDANESIINIGWVVIE